MGTGGRSRPAACSLRTQLALPIATGKFRAILFGRQSVFGGNSARYSHARPTRANPVTTRNLVPGVPASRGRPQLVLEASAGGCVDLAGLALDFGLRPLGVFPLAPGDYFGPLLGGPSLYQSNASSGCCCSIGVSAMRPRDERESGFAARSIGAYDRRGALKPLALRPLVELRGEPTGNLFFVGYARNYRFSAMLQGMITFNRADKSWAGSSHRCVLLGLKNQKRGIFMELVRRLWCEQEAQDIAEYAVMLAVILVIVVGTVRLIGSNANTVFSSVASSIQ
jgi:Flp pilus assembly pilin Flp